MRTPKKTKRATSKRDAVSASSRSEHNDSPGVTALLGAMTHRLKPTLEAVRRTILAADPAITEGIKWNSPSFYCHGWFATIASRKPTQVDIVLYCGAKVRADSSVSEGIDDSERLLTWPSKDRALLSFKSDTDFQASVRLSRASSGNGRHIRRAMQEWPNQAMQRTVGRSDA
jgi:hypothetical protein